MSKNSRLVYSTETGRLCSDCGQPKPACQCQQQAKQHIAEGDGIVRIHRETKGRKGKGVSLVTGVPLAEKELSALAKKLKQHCGCGGTVKDGIIEVQSDKRDQIKAFLEKQGYTVKLAGG